MFHLPVIGTDMAMRHQAAPIRGLSLDVQGRLKALLALKPLAELVCDDIGVRVPN